MKLFIVLAAVLFFHQVSAVGFGEECDNKEEAKKCDKNMECAADSKCVCAGSNIKDEEGACGKCSEETKCGVKAECQKDMCECEKGSVYDDTKRAEGGFACKEAAVEGDCGEGFEINEKKCDCKSEGNSTVIAEWDGETRKFTCKVVGDDDGNSAAIPVISIMAIALTVFLGKLF